MNKYYDLNPESPFFQYMQNTDEEKSLTEEEKNKRYTEAINTLIIWEFEDMTFSKDEKDYFIYVFINGIDPDVACSHFLNEKG